MNKDAQKMRELLTGFQLHVDELLTHLDIETLLLMQQACVTLEAKLRCDEMVITSVTVKAIVKDDIRMVEGNKAVIESAVKLKKELKFETMCLN